MNAMLSAAMSNDARTVNGAVSHSTTGNACLDYFSRSGLLRGRSQAEVDADMESIFAEDPELAIAIVFYNRTISRETFAEGKVFGCGQRDEFAKSLNWLERRHSGKLRNLLKYVPEVGRWSDLWYDSPVSGTYNYCMVEDTISLIEGYVRQWDIDKLELVAKYLPAIRSLKKRGNARHHRMNEFAKRLCGRLRWTEQEYRQFKSFPQFTAHEFQRQISCGWSNLDFNIVSGRALMQMVKSGTIAKHHLDEKLNKFLDEHDSVPFTGYLYELGQLANIRPGLADKQFASVLNLANDDVRNSRILPVLDTSGSMSCESVKGVSALDIAKSIGVYLSMFLQGEFKDVVCMFDDTCSLKKLTGGFSARYRQIPDNAMGSTNFQSVVDMLVNLRQKRPDIPIEDYPKTLLVVSDMQFNSCNEFLGRNYVLGRESTNHEVCHNRLAKVGLGHMSYIWWYVSNLGDDHVVKANDRGCTVLSGFDPNVINVVLGKSETKTGVRTEATRTPLQAMEMALSQPLLLKVRQDFV